MSSTAYNALRNKKLRDNPRHTVPFSGNLSHNGIARNVAEKIAQCNRALKEHSFDTRNKNKLEAPLFRSTSCQRSFSTKRWPYGTNCQITLWELFLYSLKPF